MSRSSSRFVDLTASQSDDQPDPSESIDLTTDVPRPGLSSENVRNSQAGLFESIMHDLESVGVTEEFAEAVAIWMNCSSANRVGYFASWLSELLSIMHANDLMPPVMDVE